LDTKASRGSSLHDHGQVQAPREVHRYVLHGVNGDVRLPGQHPLLQLLHEKPLAADLGERGVQYLVALRGHPDDFNDEPHVESAQGCGHMLGLPDGKGRFAGSNAECLRHGSP
jgi:hypothetical protein